MYLEYHQFSFDNLLKEKLLHKHLLLLDLDSQEGFAILWAKYEFGKTFPSAF